MRLIQDVDSNTHPIVTNVVPATEIIIIINRHSVRMLRAIAILRGIPVILIRNDQNFTLSNGQCPSNSSGRKDLTFFNVGRASSWDVAFVRGRVRPSDSISSSGSSSWWVVGEALSSWALRSSSSCSSSSSPSLADRIAR